MKAVVLICSHERKDITTENIKSLLHQSVRPKIMLVVSDTMERRFYQSIRCECEKCHDVDWEKDIIVGLHPNKPLGAKFQFGVLACRGFNPDVLIITGSDDILGRNFIKNACQQVLDGADFVGLKQWFIFHESILHLYEYRAPIPLGTRIFSKIMLNALNWRLFDVGRDRLLDDLAYYAAKRTTLNMVMIADVMGAGLNVVSVKGNWPMLNPFDKMKNHPNCKFIKSNYAPEGIL